MKMKNRRKKGKIRVQKERGNIEKETLCGTIEGSVSSEEENSMLKGTRKVIYGTESIDRNREGERREINKRKREKKE